MSKNEANLQEKLQALDAVKLQIEKEFGQG